MEVRVSFTNIPWAFSKCQTWVMLGSGRQRYMGLPAVLGLWGLWPLILGAACGHWRPLNQRDLSVGR